jgi:hypothetical protein
MEATHEPIWLGRHLAFVAAIGTATPGKQGLNPTNVNGVGAGIPRDGRNNPADKLNIEDEGMRLGDRRPPIIRRRDTAAHDDQ